MSAIVGLLLTAALTVVAVLWGHRGVELMSWLAAIGSFVVGVLTLLVTVPRRSGGGRGLRFSARARDHAQVFQAGGNITKSGNSRRRR